LDTIIGKARQAGMTELTLGPVDPKPNRHERRKAEAKERVRGRPTVATLSWDGGSVDLVSALMEFDSKTT
jgi:hypothetical protein